MTVIYEVPANYLQKAKEGQVPTIRIWNTQRGARDFLLDAQLTKVLKEVMLNAEAATNRRIDLKKRPYQRLTIKWWLLSMKRRRVLRVE